jgi:hypothetical protein
MSVYDKPRLPIKHRPDMTESDIRRLELNYDFMILKTHIDGHFIDSGILKADGTRAFDDARIARCNRYHNNIRKRRNEQRGDSLKPAA